MVVTYLSGQRIQGVSNLAGGRVGTGNGQFDGSDNLNFTGNGDMDGDFTVAFWFYRSQASAAYLTAYNQMNVRCHAMFRKNTNWNTSFRCVGNLC